MSEAPCNREVLWVKVSKVKTYLFVITVWYSTLTGVGFVGLADFASFTIPPCWEFGILESCSKRSIECEPDSLEATSWNAVVVGLIVF